MSSATGLLNRPVVRFGAPVLLLALGALGAWLVFGGGSSADQAGSAGSPRLSIGDTDMEAVASLAGLQLPADTTDFTSARLDDDTQLDVTFTIDPDDEVALIENSVLPEPRPDLRVITHASPLWELNTDGPVRGATDIKGDVARAIEFVPEDGRIRVRLVLTPA